MALEIYLSNTTMVHIMNIMLIPVHVFVVYPYPTHILLSIGLMEIFYMPESCIDWKDKSQWAC